jgi:hypothetical protein
VDGALRDRRENGFEAIQLTAVWRRVQAHEEGVGEADRRGEAEESYDENKNLLKSEGLDNDENHAGYGQIGAPAMPMVARR